MGILFLTPIFYTLGIFKYNQSYKKFTVLSPIYVRAPSFSKWPPILGWMGPVGPLCCNPRLNTEENIYNFTLEISVYLNLWGLNIAKDKLTDKIRARWPINLGNI